MSNLEVWYDYDNAVLKIFKPDSVEGDPEIRIPLDKIGEWARSFHILDGVDDAAERLRENSFPLPGKMVNIHSEQTPETCESCDDYKNKIDKLRNEVKNLRPELGESIQGCERETIFGLRAENKILIDELGEQRTLVVCLTCKDRQIEIDGLRSELVGERKMFDSLREYHHEAFLHVERGARKIDQLRVERDAFRAELEDLENRRKTLRVAQRAIGKCMSLLCSCANDKKEAWPENGGHTPTCISTDLHDLWVTVGRDGLPE